MRGARPPTAAPTALFAAAGRAFRPAAGSQPRHFSAAERMAALDTTLIGEKRAAVAAAPAAAACGPLPLSDFPHARVRNGALR